MNKLEDILSRYLDMDKSIYEIDTLEEVEKLNKELKEKELYKTDNNRNNNSVSGAIYNYLKFLKELTKYESEELFIQSLNNYELKDIDMRKLFKSYLSKIKRKDGKFLSKKMISNNASDARFFINVYDYKTNDEIKELIPKINDQIITIKDIIHNRTYKEALLYYLDFLDLYINNKLEDYLNNNDSFIEDEKNQLHTIINEKAYNKIYYGVPGCGKSFQVNRNYSKINDFRVERITFHTETYHDFIGFISPKTTDINIEYKFSPGPFTRILKKAIESDEKHVLIIEEINRGNTSGIFGDIFQLLDRDKDGSSEYFINNETISNYIYGNDTSEIRIPDNLYIVATANTSDQNTNVMDTAFLRRWDMEEVVIDYDIPEANFEIKEYENTLKADTWLGFIENINMFLEENEEEAMASDKLIGQWFTQMKNLDKDNIDSFSDKVIRYLYQDVLKYNKQVLFDNEIKTFNKLKTNIRSNDSIFNTNYLNYIETKEKNNERKI